MSEPTATPGAFPSYGYGPLHGLEIKVSSYLAGCKHALQFGNGPVYVSPAMYDLIRNADEQELKLLLDTIHIRRMLALPDPLAPGYLPMTTRPPTSRWE